jgi:hypothetical protein
LGGIHVETSNQRKNTTGLWVQLTLMLSWG